MVSAGANIYKWRHHLRLIWGRSRSLRKCIHALVLLTLLVYVALYPGGATGGPVPLVSVPADRTLVIAPHPDDETLGTGGVIARAVAEGHAVLVVVMTYGDAYTKAAQALTSAADPSPKDYLQLGVTRRQETIKALSVLGLSADKVVFLGYPDGGLRALWDSQWDAESQRVLGGPQTDKVAYADAYMPGSAFTGQNVEDSLKEIIQQFMPTSVYYPDSLDSHPDHRATSAFVKYTLALANSSVRQYTYLVHHYLWPRPLAEVPGRPLLPPKELMTRSDNWIGRALTSEEVSLKRKALRCYASQQAVMGPFMQAFVRNTELFGEAIEEPLGEGVVASPCIHGNLVDRAVTGTPRITGASVARSERLLRITLQIEGPLDPKDSLVVGIRLLSRDAAKRIDIEVDQAGARAVVKASNSVVPDIRLLENSDTHVTLEIESQAVSRAHRMMIGAATYNKSRLVNETGWLLFSGPDGDLGI